ncbi:GDSL-type esterase/lipase family protein [Streptomyces sp. NPDC051546]|uniref:GDSL-type esterase/lipase family protein n=1 Tax=Streptomyces sp. NPDC051546 TaxID=3365655 RepID=UPI0037B44206
MPHTMTTLAVAAALGVGATTTAATSAAAANPAPVVLRVMPLGDSITDGYQSSTNSVYRLQLWQRSQTHSGFRVHLVGSRQSGSGPDSDNEAHGATMINDFRGKVTDWVRGAEPDIVLLHHGVNDLDRGTDKTNAPVRLAAVTDEILAARPGVTVIVMGLIPISGPPGLPAFNTAVRRWASTKAQAGSKVRYVDAPGLVNAEMADGLHPNDAGYRKMGDAFFDGIDRTVAVGTAVRTHRGRAGTESGGADRLRWTDWDGDGRADRVLVEDDGAVRVLLNRGGDGRGGWEDLGPVATGMTTDRKRVRFADWDGDGRTDYVLVRPEGDGYADYSAVRGPRARWTPTSTAAATLTVVGPSPRAPSRRVRRRSTDRWPSRTSTATDTATTSGPRPTVPRRCGSGTAATPPEAGPTSARPPRRADPSTLHPPRRERPSSSRIYVMSSALERRMKGAPKEVVEPARQDLRAGDVREGARAAA